MLLTPQGGLALESISFFQSLSVRECSMQENLLEFIPQANAFQDRVILVTGAGAGIGQAVAIEYARFGATVVLLDKDIPRLEATYDQIVDSGYPEPAIYPLDLLGAAQNDYLELANNIKDQLGGLDGLVLNAAWLAAFMPIKLHELDLWSKTITTNLHANFLLVQACLPLLADSKDPAIIFSTDSTDKAYYGAYGVSKAGLDALCDILANEHDVEPHFVRVNRIDTGPVRTSLRTLHYPGENPNELVRPKAVVGPYLYYMSSEAGKRTGEALKLGRVAGDYAWAGESQ